jgi:hypothetical protein
MFFSEMSVDFQCTTRRYIPEDNHRCENLKSCTVRTVNTGVTIIIVDRRNHENDRVRRIGQCEAIHRKHKRLKLGAERMLHKENDPQGFRRKKNYS